MDSSATSKRKLLPFVPDLPYHLQALFILTFGYIWISAFVDKYQDPLPNDPVLEAEINRANWWRAIYANVIFLCAFAYLEPYTLDFFHPLQRFWRIVTMLALIYFCLLITLLHHRPKYGRWLLGFLDPALNQEITKGHHTYDDNCELTFENLWDNLDHYYAVHWGDWLLSSVVIRDTYILHFQHVFDEVIELSWQHILPHFRECWWDHLIVDITMSNIPAVIIGMWVQKKIGLQRYDFLGREGKSSIFEWDVWHCHKRFGICAYLNGMLVFHFLGGFFLNNNLLIPPKHAFPVCRLLIWFGLGGIALREGYEDARTWNTIQRKYEPVGGRYRWLSIAILLTEAILCWKYREDTGHINMDAETPFYIWFPWVVAFLSLVFGWLYLRFKEGHTIKYPIEPKRKVKHY